MSPLAKMQEQSKYSYKNYLHWTEGRWELIDGNIYDMTPAPSRNHQTILLKFARLIAEDLDTTSCEIFIAPFDVRLTNKPEANDEEINTVVQPDLLVVCDQNKLDERGCKGPPDLIIEILSPSTAIVDLKTKRDLYERHGVREYWIVHPTDKTLMIYRLSNDGEYKKASVLGAEDIATSDTINAIRIVLSEIFGTDEETTPFSTPPSSEPQ